jgi:hypothetical protein
LRTRLHGFEKACQEAQPPNFGRIRIARPRLPFSQGDMATCPRNPGVVLPFCRLILRADLPSSVARKEPRTVALPAQKPSPSLGHAPRPEPERFGGRLKCSREGEGFTEWELARRSSLSSRRPAVQGVPQILDEMSYQPLSRQGAACSSGSSSTEKDGQDCTAATHQHQGLVLPSADLKRNAQVNVQFRAGALSPAPPHTMGLPPSKPHCLTTFVAGADRASYTDKELELIRPSSSRPAPASEVPPRIQRDSP